VNDGGRRAVLVGGVVAVLVAIGLSGAGSSAGQSGAGGAAGTTARLRSEAFSASATAVRPSGVESSAWFCVGGTGAGGDAQATMVFTNPGARAVTGYATTVSTGSAPQSVPVMADAGTLTPVAATGPAGAEVASTVLFNGGGVGVSQILSGPSGVTTAPCASSTAPNWYFADASTAEGDTTALSLFNPTSTIAVVDVSFVAATGLLAPPAYQGIDIPGDSVVVENVGDHVQKNPHFATIVATLSGEVVATERQSYGATGSGGIAVVLGAPAPASTWSFAQNTDVAGGSTVFHVFNPSAETARVTLTIGLQEGATEPLVISVPPSSVANLDAQRVTRIPAQTTFAATFVSPRAVGIVVARQVSSPPGAAVPQQGDVVGVPGGSDRWLVPSGIPPTTAVAGWAVVNLNAFPVTVSLSTFTHGHPVAVPGYGHRRVDPGTPLDVTATAGSPLSTTPVEVVATGPVAVETDGLPAGSPGVSVIPALAQR
jgi:hypothetical protein